MKQSKMAAKQKKLLAECVRVIVCWTNMIAKMDTDAHYVYFFQKDFTLLFVFLMNLFLIYAYIMSSFFFFQLKRTKTKTNCITTKSWQNFDNYTSTMQSFVALTLLKAEQTWVVVEAPKLPIFIQIAQNKGNHESVSNLCWQLMHNKTHFGLIMHNLLNKTCV